MRATTLFAPDVSSQSGHPLCDSWLANFGFGGRVDVKALVRGEQVTYRDHDGTLLVARTLDDVRDQLAACDHLDLTVAWVDGDDLPTEWRCAKCGGADFLGVHRDYVPSGIPPGSFADESGGSDV